MESMVSGGPRAIPPPKNIFWESWIFKISENSWEPVLAPRGPQSGFRSAGGRDLCLAWGVCRVDSSLQDHTPSEKYFSRNLDFQDFWKFLGARSGPQRAPRWSRPMAPMASWARCSRWTPPLPRRVVLADRRPRAPPAARGRRRSLPQMGPSGPPKWAGL